MTTIRTGSLTLELSGWEYNELWFDYLHYQLRQQNDKETKTFLY